MRSAPHGRTAGVAALAGSLRRGATVLLLAAVWIVTTSAAGWADPARPTHYRSTILDVVAADGGEVPIRTRVLGGDAFLLLEAASGSLVEVPGYEGEPYLRFEPDGRVRVNERSPARWLNDDRYGAAGVAVPALADADAPPSWVDVADGGVYGWHDHRIHFMSPALPPQVDPASDAEQLVFPWAVPLTIDGRDAEVVGELVWVPGSGPVVPGAGVVVLLAAVAAVSFLRPGAGGALVAAGAMATAAAGLPVVVGLPPGIDGQAELVVLPAVAAGLAGLGWLLGRRRGRLGVVIAAGGGVPLAVWGVVQAGALTRPIVPGDVPLPLARGATIVALGVGLGVLAAALRVLANPPGGGPAPVGPDDAEAAHT